MRSCVVKSQIYTSLQPDAMYFPLLSHATAFTASECPLNVTTSCCVCISQMRTVLSWDPEARYLPVQSNAREDMPCVCPYRVNTFGNDGSVVSQMRIAGSSGSCFSFPQNIEMRSLDFAAPEAKYFPLLFQATAATPIV